MLEHGLFYIYFEVLIPPPPPPHFSKLITLHCYNHFFCQPQLWTGVAPAIGSSRRHFHCCHRQKCRRAFLMVHTFGNWSEILYLTSRWMAFKLQARDSFKVVIVKFLGNSKNRQYEEKAKTIMEKLQVLGCNMSLKLHFLHSNFEYFT
jgi:hypothetical protein